MMTIILVTLTNFDEQYILLLASNKFNNSWFFSTQEIQCPTLTASSSQAVTMYLKFTT